MNYQIRNAAPRDIQEIVKLCAEHAEFERADYSPAEKVDKLAEHLFADQPRLFCLIVESEAGEIFGYATFMRELLTWDADFYLNLGCLFCARTPEISESAKKL